METDGAIIAQQWAEGQWIAVLRGRPVMTHGVVPGRMVVGPSAIPGESTILNASTKFTHYHPPRMLFFPEQRKQVSR